MSNLPTDEITLESLKRELWNRYGDDGVIPGEDYPDGPTWGVENELSDEERQAREEDWDKFWEMEMRYEDPMR